MKTSRCSPVLPALCALLFAGGCERIESLLPWQSGKPQKEAAEKPAAPPGVSAAKLRREMRSLDDERERARAERERLNSELERMRSELERAEDETERLQGEIDRLESRR